MPPPEDDAAPQRRAALDPALEAERKQKRGRIVSGSIMAAAGLILLIVLWDFSSVLFEAAGPVPIDLGAFESQKDEYTLRQILDSTNAAKGGYSRHVRIANADVYNFQFLDLNDGTVLYPLISRGNTFREKIGEVDKKISEGALSIEQYKARAERPAVCKVLLQVASNVPKNKRDSQEYYTSADEFPAPPEILADQTFIGVIRRVGDLPQSTMVQIAQTPVFSNTKYDNPNGLYVLTLYEDPPPLAIALLTLAIPLLMMAFGAVMLITAFMGEGDRKRGGKAGKTGKAKGKGGRGGRGGAAPGFEDEGEEIAAPPRPAPGRRPGTGRSPRAGTGRAKVAAPPPVDEGDPDETMVQ